MDKMYCAIRTSGGNYVTAVNGGGMGEAANQLPIHTDATSVGGWERFIIVPVPAPELDEA